MKVFSSMTLMTLVLALSVLSGAEARELGYLRLIGDVTSTGTGANAEVEVRHKYKCKNFWGTYNKYEKYEKDDGLLQFNSPMHIDMALEDSLCNWHARSSVFIVRVKNGRKVVIDDLYFSSSSPDEEVQSFLFNLKNLNLLLKDGSSSHYDEVKVSVDETDEKFFVDLRRNGKTRVTIDKNDFPSYTSGPNRAATSAGYSGSALGWSAKLTMWYKEGKKCKYEAVDPDTYPYVINGLGYHDTKCFSKGSIGDWSYGKDLGKMWCWDGHKDNFKSGSSVLCTGSQHTRARGGATLDEYDLLREARPAGAHRFYESPGVQTADDGWEFSEEAPLMAGALCVVAVVGVLATMLLVRAARGGRAASAAVTDAVAVGDSAPLTMAVDVLAVHGCGATPAEV